MFARSKFFFTRNSIILNAIKQNNCKLSLSQPKIQYQSFGKLIKSRFHSTTTTTTFTRVTPPKSVGYWLFGTSTLIFGIVVLGGLTRLTESGLSITEWKPITGTLPPLNETDWQNEFTKYKESPEFKQLNSHIDLQDFKFIYSMEWGHRLMGRFIGAFFILPAIYFYATKKFTPRVTKKVIGLTGLLGLQGFIGWWMVKSGLDEKELLERNSKPTVSQYRLTTHLSAAFLMYLAVLWQGFEILQENKIITNKNKTINIEKLFQKLTSLKIKKFRLLSGALLGLTFLTAMSGGMVAGLDAGLIYNTFPHMGDDWIPSYNELMSPIFSRVQNGSDLIWRNLFENPTTVQLIHRILATTTFFSIIGLQYHTNKNKSILPKSALRAMKAVTGLACLQVTLGITTLIYLVPIPLGAAHQAGALALLTGALAFASQLRKPRPQFVSYVNKLMKQQLMK